MSRFPCGLRSFVTACALVLTLGACAAAQTADDLLPGDGRLDPEAVEEHTATHRFIQYDGDGTETEVGRLSRTVERVNHTANEPTIMVSMQFRSPTRSGLDIVYLDAHTLESRIRYLTAPTGLTTMYQSGPDLHVTYSGRDGTRQTADTTLAHPRFGGTTDLVLAALDIGEGESVRMPEISGAANTLASAMITSTVTLEARERLDLPGVWSGMARRFRETRPNGTSVVYWISEDGPHLVRQDFFDGEGHRFLRWELTEHAAGTER